MSFAIGGYRGIREAKLEKLDAEYAKAVEAMREAAASRKGGDKKSVRQKVAEQKKDDSKKTDHKIAEANGTNRKSASMDHTSHRRN